MPALVAYSVVLVTTPCALYCPQLAVTRDYSNKTISTVAILVRNTIVKIANQCDHHKRIKLEERMQATFMVGCEWVRGSTTALQRHSKHDGALLPSQ